MTNELKLKVQKILLDLLHCRFGNLEEIIEVLKNNEEVKEVIDLCEDKMQDCPGADDSIVGTILLETGEKIDINLWYLIDNAENYYITETEPLEEVD